MSTRKVIDEDGRTWECKAEDANNAPGRDVTLQCSTKGLKKPFQITVSWKWAKMAERGLARMILSAAPEPLPAE